MIGTSRRAPALFTASIYMELSRAIILADSESHALIKKKWLTKLFVCGDVMSFLVQIGSKLSTHSIIHHQDILTSIL
jgi:hypothetical protein